MKVKIASITSFITIIFQLIVWIYIILTLNRFPEGESLFIITIFLLPIIPTLLVNIWTKFGKGKELTEIEKISSQNNLLKKQIEQQELKKKLELEQSELLRKLE